MFTSSVQTGRSSDPLFSACGGSSFPLDFGLFLFFIVLILVRKQMTMITKQKRSKIREAALQGLVVNANRCGNLDCFVTYYRLLYTVILDLGLHVFSGRAAESGKLAAKKWPTKPDCKNMKSCVE